MPSPFLPIHPLILLIYPTISFRPSLLDIVSTLILHIPTIQEPYNIPLGLSYPMLAFLGLALSSPTSILALLWMQTKLPTYYSKHLKISLPIGLT
jgi:hypothetical protein